MKKSNMNPTTTTTTTATAPSYVIWTALKSYEGNHLCAKVYGQDAKSTFVHEFASVTIADESDFKPTSNMIMMQTVKFLLKCEYRVFILENGTRNEVDLESATQRFQ
jgi:hypothetical protein